VKNPVGMEAPGNPVLRCCGNEGKVNHGRFRGLQTNPSGSSRMKAGKLFSPVRWLGMVVLLLMAVAVVYAG